MKVRIFTDGACSGNPGPGGWAAAYASENGIYKIHGGKSLTTNNEMELTAVVQALEYYLDKYILNEVNLIEIHSDSAYVVNAINQNWVEQWKSNGWITTTKGKPVKNCRLWQRLQQVISYLNWCNVVVRFIKVKGHSGNELNEMVDQMAKEEINKRRGN